MNHTKSASFLLAVLILSWFPMITGIQSVSLTLVSNPYTIEQSGGHHRIVMEGFFTRGIPGNPVLPQKVYNVEVPYEADLKSVNLQILWEDSQEILGVYEVGPSPLIAADTFYTIQNGKNTDVYKKDALYPLNPVDVVRTYQVKNKKYVRIQFTPFQYNPVTKKLVLTSKVGVRVSWNVKYAAYTGPKALGVGYVIVTTNAVVTNSTRLNGFAAYLQSRGFTMYTVTENQYGVSTGQARAVNIRNWLQANCPVYNVKYVLLIGDPDPDDPTTGDTFGDLPMMMCWPNPGSTADQTPTDYYYADLTGNWDFDGDSMYGEFGEDAVDFGPEVYVGRIPVYGGNYAALDSILSKFINYTGANTSIMLPMALSNYQDEENAFNGCVAGWLRTDGLNLPQQVITNIANPAGFTSYVMYETAGVVGRGHDPVPVTAYGYKALITNANVINEWARDYGIVFWWAHGSQTGASRKYWLNDLNNNFTVEDGVCAAADELTWPNLLTSADTAALADTETFTFQCSCCTGHPENSGNLQYSLLKRGAVSTVGATRFSWYAQGVWTFTGIVDNASIGYVYVGNLVFGWSSGEALYNGKSMLANPWGWQGWQNLFGFNLYGDPSMYLEKPILQPPPGGEPPKVNLTRVLCPLAKYKVEKARALLEEAKSLLQQAKDGGKDISEIEPMIDEAEKLIERANRYCFANNCIPGNYAAIQAIELLKEAIEKLKQLLSC
ncbi:MAG: hypothetical protein AYK19_07620 [Theionarchaea archaeon DG-70-1]|nr:MAG: hypothetical protein AYK19_07620 [Theionarchaea archaeon DG-70-1]